MKSVYVDELHCEKLESVVDGKEISTRNNEEEFSEKKEHMLYEELKELEEEYSLLEIQDEYLKYEQLQLKSELVKAREELNRIKSPPLLLNNFIEMVDENYGLVDTKLGSSVLVRLLSQLDREKLKTGVTVAVHKTSMSVVEILSDLNDSVGLMTKDKKPNVTYSSIGGLEIQKQEIREAVELPLTQPELYKQLGIEPPRGVLLYGPPGTGKTMLAKAVAQHTTASFIHVVGSEFVQKYLGEGSRMVRDVFKLARANAPSIIFIDEIDAIGTKRYDSQNGADREVQRILIELLNQIDGFDSTDNVKVIMATNRHDTLDPALLRPGRLDRKIFFPIPNRREKHLIFHVILSKMNLSVDFNIDDLISKTDKITPADISSICMEAGMNAIRNGRYVVSNSDFHSAYKKIVLDKDSEIFFP